MCSRPFRPLGFAHLCRSRPRGSVHSLLRSSLKPVRLGPFHVAHPIRSIETRSAPAFSRCYPRSFAFYLGKPISSIQATGPSVSQPFGLSTALVRNWSSLFLNRMLCETFSLLVRSGMENVSSCARMKGWRRLWNWKRRFIVSSHRHKAPPAQAPPMLNSARWHCTSPRRGRGVEWNDQRRGIRFHFRPRRFCRRCASDASQESVGNAGSIDVTTSDIPLRTDSVKRCKG